ncbi:Uncharacterised protein [Candidatus Gugararchaeum adminiculabundum]|nr:Uncharacterised protein [Candidatus Gugararchaeum adminiculabundum]
MRIIADLHIHSKYSRACSPELDVPHLSESAKIKGIGLLGTGDFTHPEYFAELKKYLKESDGSPGLYEHKGQKFLLQTEISSIYGHHKVHTVIFAPSLEVVAQINDALGKRGNLKADGRPILGISALELAEIVLGISNECMVIPAHAWTPWFSVFGANSGFDSLKECFGELTSKIYAIETGLSSDPPMNWRISALDKVALISNSDAHSPAKLGREANVFELDEKEFNYRGICEAIRKKDKKRFLCTYEFFPEEGKYHVDGHRNCGVRLSPEEAIKLNNVCPKCGKKVTMGVLHRVNALADRPDGFVPGDSIPFKHLVPLREIVAKSLDKGEFTKGVVEEYGKLVRAFGNEFAALNASFEEVRKVSGDRIAD